MQDRTCWNLSLQSLPFVQTILHTWRTTKDSHSSDLMFLFTVMRTRFGNQSTAVDSGLPQKESFHPPPQTKFRATTDRT